MENPVKRTHFRSDPIKNKSRADLVHVQMSHRISAQHDSDNLFCQYSAQLGRSHGSIGQDTSKLFFKRFKRIVLMRIQSLCMSLCFIGLYIGSLLKRKIF